MVPKFTRFLLKLCCHLNIFVLFNWLTAGMCRAQTIKLNSPRREQLAQIQDIQPVPPKPPPTPSLPEELPPPSELLQPSTPTQQPSQPLPETPDTVIVKKFDVVGSTVFSQKELAKVLKPFTNKPITFAQLLQARSAITQLYIDNKYITSEAYIPIEQSIEDGVVKIIIEGQLEDIEITGLKRLESNYIRSRIALATKSPLNQEQLLKSLQLLQINPLIDSISARLSTGTRPGLNILSVQVKEAPSFHSQIVLDNSRPSSSGSFRRGVKLDEANLLGLGDAVSFKYDNTDGSNAFDLSYTLPVSPSNATFSLRYNNTSSKIIEPDFNTQDIEITSSNIEIDSSDIEVDSSNIELTFRQPLVQNPTQEFALGVTASRNSQDIFWPSIQSADESTTIPLNQIVLGTDEDGRTDTYIFSFFQEWTSRHRREVIAARSQFSAAVGTFSSPTNNNSSPTTNNSASINNRNFPDRRFFLWRGQAQWLRLLAPKTFLLIRGDAQLASETVLPSQKFKLAGVGKVRRGYEQNDFLRDNGIFASAELQLPIVSVPEIDGVLQVVPFVDTATGWNSSGSKDFISLASVGLGLRWSQKDNFIARLDWAIPSISDSVLYFSLKYNPF